MESHRFDILAQRLGTGSRRQALAAFVAGAIAPLFLRTEANEVAAKCKGYKGKCKKKSSCCGQAGLHCHKDRCRCKKGWKRCSETGPGCTNVKSDPDNCGTCGNECPAGTPCCINGSCQELCGGSCCADCFMDFLNGETPQPLTATCCGPGSGTICSSTKQQTSDDECCWPDQECVNGGCCCDGCQGAVICGGACCPSVACCNGECCPDGQVCGQTTEGLACVTADRECSNCLPGEVCHDGVCCSGDRVCTDILDGDFCCPVGEYCNFMDPVGGCCAINTTCKTTWRGHRVRK
jgi:hypothetical protein